jgi:raffinose/stachyose/melibiose transport system permease protein
METRRQHLAAHTILILFSIIALYPFLSILMLSLNEPGKRSTGFSIPSGLHFGNYVTAWTDGGFATALVSSAIVAVSVVSIAVFCSTMAAYAFGTQRLIGGGFLFALLLVGLVMPYEAMIVPLFYTMRDLGLTNTYWALILPQVGLSMAFGTFWMRAAFEASPRSLSEAAAVDGATRWIILWKILLPQVRPALLTLAVLLFMFTWNEFLLALVMIQDESLRTAPLALSFFAGNRRTGDPAVIAAAAVMVALPILIVYIFLQRKFISGMVAGAVKG